MSSVRSMVLIFVLATLAVAGPAVAQDGKALSVRAYGGGVESLSDIHTAMVYDTKFGTGFGGGLGYQVTDVFTVLGDLNVTKAPLQYQGADYGADFNRVFGSVIAQFHLPRDRTRPYLMTGLGATFIKQPQVQNEKPTFGHWLGGAGIEFAIGGSGLALVTESKVYVYQARGLVGNPKTEPRVMADAVLSAGLSYRFGG